MTGTAVPWSRGGRVAPACPRSSAAIRSGGAAGVNRGAAVRWLQSHGFFPSEEIPFSQAIALVVSAACIPSWETRRSLGKRNDYPLSPYSYQKHGFHRTPWHT